MNHYIKKGYMSKKAIPLYKEIKKLIPNIQPCLTWYDDDRFLAVSFTKPLTKHKLNKIKNKYFITDSALLVIEIS